LQSPSEGILQGELHDPGVSRRKNLTECIAAERICRTSRNQAVCYIERLAAKLEFLIFANLEGSGYRRIELPVCGTFDIRRPHVSDRSQIRLNERTRIQIPAQGTPIAERTAKHLARALRTAVAVEVAVLTTENRQETSGGVSVDSRYAPSREQRVHRAIRKLR